MWINEEPSALVYKLIKGISLSHLHTKEMTLQLDSRFLIPLLTKNLFQLLIFINEEIN